MSNRKPQLSDDDEKRMKRREKNRVAAQRSRKRQTQRADELHEAYECLEQQNSLLKKEVQVLLEEQKRLAEALQSHEPLCPVLNHEPLSYVSCLNHEPLCPVLNHKPLCPV
uniref:BZIP domain-containing protein n=1 Tax=Electrophorus electricus TaxID=8005 RepID=A0A4W4HNH8_ELEEL